MNVRMRAIQVLPVALVAAALAGCGGSLSGAEIDAVASYVSADAGR